MRPQQQNRRMRGRGNGNRKGPNPLNRSYESNGPDVKIRGTAQQIADKYATLARDAQSSGDRVIAENYLQHAEHYNRIIAAAQAQVQPQQNSRDGREEGDEDFDERNTRDEQTAPAQNGAEQRSRVDDGTGPQPVIDGTPAEVALNERQRSNRANGAKANGNGRDYEETSEAEAGKEAEASSKAADDTEEASEAKPKPAKRTRRPRAKKADEQAAAGTEEAPAQS
ncbi:DUF4167 domain-containing protein [Nitratireductor sp. GCM10026969]|uniref:DUF4167 domain-containing protein n=1 Tax=Nitratireductor sp. GCM10026969 TaxID=3252645 RepID=UPI00360B88AA